MNEDTIIIFDLREVLDDRPIEGLLPYSGEKGHLVVIRKSVTLTAKDYIQTHAMEESVESQIQFMTHFPNVNLCKLWCQSNRGGNIRTADFWIRVQH